MPALAELVQDEARGLERVREEEQRPEAEDKAPPEADTHLSLQGGSIYINCTNHTIGQAKTKNSRPPALARYLSRQCNQRLFSPHRRIASGSNGDERCGALELPVVVLPHLLGRDVSSDDEIEGGPDVLTELSHELQQSLPLLHEPLVGRLQELLDLPRHGHDAEDNVEKVIDQLHTALLQQPGV